MGLSGRIASDLFDMDRKGLSRLNLTSQARKEINVVRRDCHKFLVRIGGGGDRNRRKGIGLNNGPSEPIKLSSVRHLDP